jgi:hypothetical protein
MIDTALTKVNISFTGSNRRIRACCGAWLILLTLMAACGTRSLSGTYIARGSDSAEMLQLTETSDGRITGVASVVSLGADGKINSGQGPIQGVTDGNQITLTARCFLFETNVSGVFRHGDITFQTVGANGDIREDSFERASPRDFKEYADQLKVKSEARTLSMNLLGVAQQLQRMSVRAEKLISDAEVHSRRIPAVHQHYQKIEDDMRALLAAERSAANPVARGQMFVRINQGEIAGTQADLELNRIWDQSIGGSGQALSREYQHYTSNCDIRKDLQKRGATPQAIDVWVKACQQSVAARASFDRAFKRIMEQRAELKSFQSAAAAHRQALVAAARRTE